MTDELFDYFGKGSKKFEPLDDDLDLPEVSPKRKDDVQDETAELEPVEAKAEPADDTSVLETESAVDSIDEEDVFAGFGAGLFDASTAELPPRTKAAKAKPVAEAKPVVKKQAKPEAKSKPAKSKPADPKPVEEKVAAADQSEDSEGGTWDFIAGVLGIGGKKAKPDEDAGKNELAAGADASDSVGKAKQKPAAPKSQAKAVDKALFQEPKPASEAAVDALFNTADDGLDLAGWGDDEDESETEEPVAAKPAKLNGHLDLDEDESRPTTIAKTVVARAKQKPQWLMTMVRMPTTRISLSSKSKNLLRQHAAKQRLLPKIVHVAVAVQLVKALTKTPSAKTLLVHGRGMIAMITLLQNREVAVEEEVVAEEEVGTRLKIEIEKIVAAKRLQNQIAIQTQHLMIGETTNLK